MKPVFVFAPYWMGKFSPIHAAQARHTWRLLAVPPVDGSATTKMGALCLALANEVAAIRVEGNLPVAVVGDCTFSIGVAAGLQRDTPDFSLIWFDAHGDFNTPQTTPSNFIGGMPLAMLCGRGEQTIVSRAGAVNVPEANVFLTDGRDLDPLEADAVAGSALVHLTDVSQLVGLELPDRPIYIHFDVDVLRLADMAAVNYPAEGGPSLQTLEAALARLASTGRVAAVSVTMWNPELDEDNRAETVVMNLVESLVDKL